MDLIELLDADLIWVNSSLESREEIFELVTHEALKTQKVTADFAFQLKRREEVFPTGLQLETSGIAIPHTDPEYVNDQFIAVITLDKGVVFQRMDDANELVAVNYVFVLGLNEPHKQLTVLQELMARIQNQQFLDQLKTASQKQQIFDAFKLIDEAKKLNG